MLCGCWSFWQVETLATVILAEKERDVRYRDGGVTETGVRAAGVERM